MRLPLALSLTFALAAPVFAQTTVTGTAGTTLQMTELATFDGAWAMTFLPDGRALVTEQAGSIWLLNQSGAKIARIGNVPDVQDRGQGGLGDIIIDPDFATNNIVYISYVERDAENNRLSGAAVTRATLTLTSNGGTLSDGDVIWRQFPKVTGNGHYGHRMVISPDGYLFITSGDRQKFTPAQNMDMNLGKVIRLNRDGSVPEDNPFFGQGGVTNQIWSLGHRNPLGIDFDAEGDLWLHEMGPKHGDELNRVLRSENYGYPVVSNGDHYSGKEIPDHSTNPIYENPAAYWVPAISPAGFTIYDGDLFEDFKSDGFIGGLSSQALIRVVFDSDKIEAASDSPSKSDRRETIAAEAERFEWGKRIREVEQGPDGALYVLEDNEGRLLKLTPG
ncbi:dehydrogenase [Algimonas ampicilliniresistens]|uniref:Dehydrogenase n=1 Tax=Algimonas ampicilliniresistens TaxID=1298735 RepID=A0ABQ5V9C6_9PROT|nr:PQQ-dependent sugar dehydrogenase [Algimonas ampicilliniresistens]GLQ24124.1 dehydrogenase [Algimonas ampicilliniresistens]